MSEVLSITALRKLVDGWIAEGKRLAGPRRVARAGASKDAACPGGPEDPKSLVLYGWLDSSDQLLMDGFIHPGNSVKEFVFPRHEKLYGYKVQGKNIEIQELEMPDVEQILVGVRPCDAASLPILDHVFNWDYKDALYNRRRELTTVVTLACREHDANCFCTSVGSGPGDERGSDAVLLDLGDGKYEVCCLTEKGTKLFAGCTETSDVEGQIAPGPEKRIDLDAVRKFLASGYESPEWQLLTQRCLGCGACAYTCPTCHCFDMVDELTPGGGVRARNWDACQFAMFTAHASGHNPRSVQSQRQRQRIYHKFQIYPDKFGELLCTGCGNCTRNCPVGLGVRSVLEAVAGEQGK
jgi:ferredoxin